jgi:hypothetical protein
MRNLWSSEPVEDEEDINTGVEGTDGGAGDDSNAGADDAGDAGADGDKGAGADDASGSQVIEKIVEKIVEKDPFEGWEDNQKQLFETFKKGDLNELKAILDEMTADYDSLDDESAVREYIKRTNPKWTTEMVESELSEKYGIGIDDDDFSEGELMKFKKNLIKDSDLARTTLNDSKSKVKLPDVKSPEKKEDVVEDPEALEKAQKAWEKSVEVGLKGINKDTYKVEVDENGVKRSIDFEFEYSQEDISKIKEDISKFNIENDFRTRYISDDLINTEKLMKDRFILDNVNKLLATAYQRGSTEGALKRDAELKNIDFNGDNTSGFANGEDESVNMAKFFLGKK